MLQRSPFYPLVALLLAGMLLGCTQPQETPKGAETPRDAAKAEPKLQLKVPETIAEPKTAAQAPVASPAIVAEPSPQTAAQRGEPKGRVVYAWHTAISPSWVDPQENPAFVTPYAYAYALHDALVKPMPGNVFTPSLAETYDIAPDFKSATFTLREGLTFHNGEPVTSEDVKFTFENYRGANAQILHAKTEAIDTPDARTVRFVFKEPFLDFLVLYATPASGAGWVVPQKYYQEVGPDGFKQKPIGAGPFKFVEQRGGTEFEFEAFRDYWRKTPHVKTLIIKAMPEAATRVAALSTGEVDFVNFVPGQLLETVQQDANLQLAPTLNGTWWLEFPGLENPANPFHDKRVRQAASLALDRQKLNEAETGGFSKIEGNWIPEDWPGALQLPPPQHDLEQAKQLMTEAGFADGFEVENLTPLPPYFSFAERVITQLRAIGIRTKLNQMERGAFFERLSAGPGALQGLVLNVSGAPGDAAARIRSYALCEGASSRTCVPEIDEKFQAYEAATDPREREKLLNEVQQTIINDYIFITVYRSAFINGQGPRIANEWDTIVGAIPQYVYVGPYEDIRLTE